MTETHAGLPVLSFASQREWEDWLDANHASSTGIWIKIAKKASGVPSVDHPRALESALISGWIDGQRDPLDETFFLQKFTPRRPKSRWSQINVAKVEALIRAGRMQPAGLAQVEAAKADGRWAAAYEPQSQSSVPDDLRQALDANPAAAALFARLNSQNRYAVLYRLRDAKRPETRARRLAAMVAMLNEGRTFYPMPQRRRPPGRE